MANEEIKALIKRHRLFRYEVAEAAGMSEGLFINPTAKTAHRGHRSQDKGSYHPAN